MIIFSRKQAFSKILCGTKSDLVCVGPIKENLAGLVKTGYSLNSQPELHYYFSFYKFDRCMYIHRGNKLLNFFLGKSIRRTESYNCNSTFYKDSHQSFGFGGT
jgi:hypothetical protein